MSSRPGSDHAVDTSQSPPPASAYQEVLRAIGRRLDHEGWHAIVLIEDKAGLVIRGARAGAHGEETVVLRLTPAELYREVLAARRQRGRGAPPRHPPPAWLAAHPPPPTVPLAAWLDGTSYQGRLRALGWLSDRLGLRQVRVREERDDLLLEGWRTDGSRWSVAAYRLTSQDFQRLLYQLVGQRRAAPAGESGRQGDEQRWGKAGALTARPVGPADPADPVSAGGGAALNAGVRVDNFYDIAGYSFAGPYEQGFVPHQPGIYLVLYGQGNWYLLDVDQADDVPGSLAEHPRAACWDRLRQGAPLAVAIHATALPFAGRRAIVQQVRQALPDLPCGGARRT